MTSLPPKVLNEIDPLLAQELAERKAWPVPWPQIVLYGCRPLVPYHGQPLWDEKNLGESAPFHAGEITPDQVGDHPWPSKECPHCGGSVGPKYNDKGEVTFLPICQWCSGMGATWDANAKIQRDLHEAREAAKEVEIELEQQAVGAIAEREVLCELDRRRIWNGYARGSRLRAIAEDSKSFKSIARIGREWLKTIGQEPDYDIVIDTTGKVLGRYSEGWKPEED